MAGAPWNAHEWLSEIIMALSYRMAGFAGIYALFGLAAGLAMYFLARWVLDVLPLLPSLIVLIFPLGIITEAIQARPQYLALAAIRHSGYAVGIAPI